MEQSSVSQEEDPGLQQQQQQARRKSIVANISPVALRTLTGSCHASNKHAIDWSVLSGLLALGSNALVVVVDPVTLQTVQVLDKHRSSVVRVTWCKVPTSKHPADRLTLASSDATGHIVIWNVKSGEVGFDVKDSGIPLN